MITGFNTDVKHNSKVYHVQTEDKGRTNPKIESLVYVGGEILDSHQTVYEDREGLSEDQIMEMLEKQHKRVIRGIKTGLYDEEEAYDQSIISGRELDDLIVTYLQSEPPSDHMVLTAQGFNTLRQQDQARVRIETRKAKDNDPVLAQVRIKLVAPDQKPVILSQMSTDQNGILTTAISLPHRPAGDAAVMIQAISDFGTAEHKFPINGEP